jgi:hypothetical protein
MQISIKTLTGRKTNFNFEPENCVKDVKTALEEKEGKGNGFERRYY